MSANKKYTDLKDFLRKHKTIPDKEFTHTSLGNIPHSYPGSYCIEDDELNLFYNLYNKHVFEKKRTCSIPLVFFFVFFYCCKYICVLLVCFVL